MHSQSVNPDETVTTQFSVTAAAVLQPAVKAYTLHMRVRTCLPDGPVRAYRHSLCRPRKLHIFR